MSNSPYQKNGEDVLAMINGLIGLLGLGTPVDNDASVDNAHLCQPCRDLTFEKLLRGVYHHENTTRLVLCITCPLCQLFVTALSRPSENWWGDETPEPFDKIKLKLVTDSTDLDKFPQLLYVGVTRPKAVWQKYLSEVPDNPYNLDPELRFRKPVVLCTDKTCRVSETWKIRPLSREPFSAENVELVQSWIGDCAANHKECMGFGGQESEDRQLPDRVIDVGPADGSEEPYLLVKGSSPSTGRWAALSYKWGAAKFIKLLKASVDEMRKCLPLNDLPPGFQDAVKITRELGLRYLWIDALCIIQDSPEDWREQSAKMPEIYAGAYVTLAAAGNTSPDEPILQDRVAMDSANPAVEMKLGDKGVLQFTRRDPYHPLAARVLRLIPNEDVLLERGWCLQERLLSRRTLIFKRQEITFICGRQILFESYHNQDPAWQAKQSGPFGAWLQRFEDGDGSWRNDFFSIVHDSIKEGIYPNKNHDEARERERAEREAGRVIHHLNTTPAFTYRQKLYERWFLVLDDYTSRKLTYDSDKFAAIAGVAKYIIENGPIGDEYHAGHFKSSFPHSLLWKIPRQAKWNEDWTNSRPQNRKTPSWSWASMEGALDFERCWKYLHQEPVCEVLSVETPGSRLDSFPEGRITLRGFYFRAMITSSDDHLRSVPGPSSGALGGGTFHADDRPKEEEEVICIQLIPDQGIMLREIQKATPDGAPQYQRVGIYSTSMGSILSSRLDDANKIEVTIV